VSSRAVPTEPTTCMGGWLLTFAEANAGFASPPTPRGSQRWEERTAGKKNASHPTPRMDQSGKHVGDVGRVRRQAGEPGNIPERPERPWPVEHDRLDGGALESPRVCTVVGTNVTTRNCGERQGTPTGWRAAKSALSLQERR